MNVQRLNRKVALVSGGASGLGKAIAERLALEGASVVVTDIQASLGQGVAEKFGGYFMPQDVTDEAQWNRIIGDIQERLGGLHILVNNAGILGPRDKVSPEDTRLEDWRRILTVNLDSVFLGCRAAIPAMQTSGGGSIINISSVAGLLATPHATAYGVSKAAVRHLTKIVAQHCAEKRLKIRCNSVHPGDVRTPLWDDQAADAARKRGISIDAFVEECEAGIPTGHLTEPQDIAAVVAFLASDESRQMTGAKFVVDGGVIDCDTFRRRMARRQQEAASQ